MPGAPFIFSANTFLQIQKALLGKEWNTFVCSDVSAKQCMLFPMPFSRDFQACSVGRARGIAPMYCLCSAMFFWVSGPKGELRTHSVLWSLPGPNGLDSDCPGQSLTLPLQYKVGKCLALTKSSVSFSQVCRLPPSSVQPGESNSSFGIGQTLLVIGFGTRHSAPRSSPIWLVLSASFRWVLCKQQRVVGSKSKPGKRCLSCGSFSSLQLGPLAAERLVFVENGCRDISGHLRVSGFQTRTVCQQRDLISLDRNERETERQTSRISWWNKEVGVCLHKDICKTAIRRANTKCFTLLDCLLCHKTTFCFLLFLQHSTKRHFVWFTSKLRKKPLGDVTAHARKDEKAGNVPAAGDKRGECLQSRKGSQYFFSTCLLVRCSLTSFP